MVHASTYSYMITNFPNYNVPAAQKLSIHINFEYFTLNFIAWIFLEESNYQRIKIYHD